MADEPKTPLQRLSEILGVRSEGADKPKTPLQSLSEIAGVRNVRSEGLDPGSFGALAALLAAAAPARPPQAPLIRDGWFKGETIKIDGYTFERCRFDGCKLVTEKATFTFKHCFITQDCGLYLIGPALRVGRLLMHVLRLKSRITTVAGEEALYAPVHDDGTFTIE